MKPERNTTAPTQPDIEARKRWMGTLARTDINRLEEVYADLDTPISYEYLRQPETGMTMIRGRADAKGGQFNLGEMTISRCSIRLEDGNIGHGYVSGRNKRHAELAAVFDALLQQPDTGNTLQSTVDTLADEHAERIRHTNAKTAATKVNFFTMVRGED